MLKRVLIWHRSTNFEDLKYVMQHHGTTLVKYFYHQAQEKMKQETSASGMLNPINLMSPPIVMTVLKTASRRAIIFFADSVEAAARSLPKVTQHSIEEY